MDDLIKIFTIGTTEVGKTCIINKFSQNTFTQQSNNTQGLDFTLSVITINNQNHKFQIWDTAGQERYRSLTTSYFNKAQGILLVFALDNRKSFDQLNQWLGCVKNSAKENVKLMLVGNKNDIENREVTKEEAIEYAKANNLEYYETSALRGDNIKEVFIRMGELIVYNLKYNEKIQTNAKDKKADNANKEIGKEEANAQGPNRNMSIQFNRKKQSDDNKKQCNC